MTVTWERNVTQVTWESATAPGITWTTTVNTGGGGGGGTFDGVHNDLDGRSAADAHPISAITGLQTTLDLAANPGHVEATGTTPTEIDALLGGLGTVGAFTGSLTGPTMTLTPPAGGVVGRAQWSHPSTLPIGLGAGVDGLLGARFTVTSGLADVDGLVFAIVNTNTGALVDGSVVNPTDNYSSVDTGAALGEAGKAIVYNAAPVTTSDFILQMDTPFVVNGQDPGDLAIVVALVGNAPVTIHIEWLYGSWAALRMFEQFRIGYGLQSYPDGTIGIKELWRDLPTATAGAHDGRDAVDALEVVPGWRSDCRRIIADAPTHPRNYAWTLSRVAALRRQLTTAHNGVWETLAVGSGGQAPTEAEVPGASNGDVVAVRCTEWNGHWRDENLLGGTPVMLPDGTHWVTLGDGLDCDFVIPPGRILTKRVNGVAVTTGGGPSITDGDSTVVIWDNDESDPSLTVFDWDQGETQVLISEYDGLLFDLTSDAEVTLSTTQLDPLPTLIVVDGLDGGGTHDVTLNRGQLWYWPGYGDQLQRLCWGPTGGGGGGGAVDSVNGHTGTVVLTASDVGAAPTSRTITAGTGLTGGGTLAADRTLAADFGTTAGKVTEGNDARLSDARTPTAHKTSHQSGGADELALAASQITSGTLAAARLPGKWTTITQQTLGSAQASISVDVTGYRLIKVYIAGRTARTSAGSDNIGLRFNSDSDNNYSSNGGALTSIATIGTVAASQTNTDRAGYITALIGLGSSAYTSGESASSFVASTGTTAATVTTVGFLWNGSVSAAVTSMQILSANGHNLSAGFTVVVEGIT